ncbi:MAG TPA: acyltransferase [Xanthobacteraceae bacterium]|nr:acyltransferase [Xanthobacteraceae bacterium]
MSSADRFDARLESLRGLAAVAVVVTHTTAIFRVDGSSAFWTLPLSQQTIHTWPLELLTAVLNPGSAVILFFVLSGYVLSISLDQSGASLAGYGIKRAFRLLPPMWASIAVMAVISSTFPLFNAAPYSEWFLGTFQPFGPADVLENAVVLSSKANPVTWTMYVEAIGSALVPASLWLSGRHGRTGSYVLLAALCGLTVLAFPRQTFIYLLCFQLGVTLAKFPPSTAVSPAVLAASGFLIFFLDRLALHGPWSIIANTVGAALILMAIKRGFAERSLLHGFVRSVGRCSYSIYLFQLPVIYATGLLIRHIIDPGLAATVLALAVVLTATLSLAKLTYALFEQPSVRAGRHLARRAAESGSETRARPIEDAVVDS